MGDFLDLSKFSKQSFINEGSFGKVYKVIEKETGKVFAAKISQNNVDDDQKSLLINLKREIGIMSQLNHPSILKFIGYSPIDFDNEPKPVIISEYSPNGSLANLIALESQSRSLPMWDDTKKLITLYGISSAMSFLHSHNIIHRDLKPENILEDDFLFPKIADFGFSKILHSNSDSMSTQSTTGVKGTPIYVPPEGWENNECSKAGDVYAFAIIAYEIMTLEIPFKDYTFMMLCRRVAMNGERPTFKYPIPDCYRDLITRCWSQDPEKRPTFEQIKEELKTNPDFITETIDKDQFLDYVEMIDNCDCSFDPQKKFKKVMISKVTETDSNNSEDGKKDEEIQIRERKFERKEVVHHTPHSLFGRSSKNHTHYTIFHITSSEQRTVATDSNGNKSFSDWTLVPGSEVKQEVCSGMEGGFTDAYEREI